MSSPMPDSSSVDRPVMVGQCSSPNLSTLYFACAVATIAGVREAPASIGYEAWLISKGCTPALARLTAALMGDLEDEQIEDGEELPIGARMNSALRLFLPPGYLSEGHR